MRRLVAATSERLGLRLEGLWLRILPLLTRDYLWVKADGLHVYGSTHYQRFLYRLMRGSFEPFSVQLFKQAMEPGMVVLDIGAYIGYYSLLAARGVGSPGKVYAFECDPKNYRFLLHNLKLNELGADVELVRKAVAHQAGAKPLFVYRGDASQNSLWYRRGGGTAIEVECTTVDEVLGERPAHVIKMDIEGGEIHALKGMEKTLRNSDEVTMFVECHPHALSSAGGSAEILLARLEELGFRIQVIDESERRLRPASELMYKDPRGENKKYAVNLYCRKEK